MREAWALLAQALIATALGLPPQAFRLMLQSNGATTAISFAPAAQSGLPAQAVLQHVNQVTSAYPSTAATASRTHALHQAVHSWTRMAATFSDPGCTLAAGTDAAVIHAGFPCSFRSGLWHSSMSLRLQRRATSGYTSCLHEETQRQSHSAMGR